MVRIKNVMPKKFLKSRRIRRRQIPKPSWVKLFTDRNTTQEEPPSNPLLTLPGADEDDVLYNQSSVLPETLYLDYPVSVSQEGVEVLPQITEKSPQACSKGVENLDFSVELPILNEAKLSPRKSTQKSTPTENPQADGDAQEILPEEPEIAISKVPFKVDRGEGVKSKKKTEKKKENTSTPVRWSMRKSSTDTEDISHPAGEDKEKRKLSSKSAGKTESSAKRRKIASSEEKVQRSTRSSSSGKSSIPRFVDSDATSYMPFIANKNILPQRKVDVKDFSSKTNLIELLESRNLLKSVTLSGSFVKNVLREFYCNLNDISVDYADITFGKVFVRGVYYDVSPRTINDFLGLKPVSDVEIPDEKEMWQELTNGICCELKPAAKLSCALLKSSYSILLRVAASHWMPTTHVHTVPKSMSVLLFKIKMGLLVNLGQLIFDQISMFAKKNFKENSNGLPFPVLIYQLLLSQGFKPFPAEIEEPRESPLQVDWRHFSDKHYNDMTGNSMGNKEVNSSSIVKYLEKEIKGVKQEIATHHAALRSLEEKKKMLTQLLKRSRMVDDESSSSQGEEGEED